VAIDSADGHTLIENHAVIKGMEMLSILVLQMCLIMQQLYKGFVLNQELLF
jgi:hypothetical protein